jgi:hypothetical protein
MASEGINVRMRAAPRLALFACALLLAASAMARVPLVSGGEARVCIVCAADASPHERHAAAEFTNYIFRATGVRVPVAASAPAGLMPFGFRSLSRDEGRALGIKNDGFRIDAGDGGVTLSAVMPRGIVFGAYYILSRYAGVRWFHLESGDDIEPRESVCVSRGATVKNPCRRHDGAFTGDVNVPAVNAYCQTWNARNGFTTAWASDEKLGTRKVVRGGGHVVGDLLLATPVDENERARIEKEVRVKYPQMKASVSKAFSRWKCLSERHPEWFGLVNGRRVPCGITLRHETELGTSMPCLSNPQVRRALAESFKSWRATVPAGTEILYTLFCDDHTQWCECEGCMKYLKEKGRGNRDDKASDLWWLFVNDFAQAVLSPADPDLSISVGVYLNYRAFPSKVKPVPLPGMSVLVCPHGRDYLHPLAGSDGNALGTYGKMIERWSDIGMPVDTFEYMNQVPGASNYIFWERAWVADLKWYLKRDISPSVWGVGPWNGYRSMPTYFRRNAAKARWQVLWLTGWFIWDPQDDFETVRDDMFRRYYRAAAKPMTEYRKLLEKAVAETGLKMPYVAEGSASDLIPCAAGRGDVMHRARRLLKEAEALAASDAVLSSRIGMDAEYFRTNWESSLVENAIRNASFDETEDFKPKGENGIGWKIGSKEMPKGWIFCSCNGGQAKCVKSGGRDDPAYLRVGPGGNSDRAFIMTYLKIYPKTVDRARVSFRARGKARIMVRPLGKGCETPEIAVDSSEWRRYAVKLALNGSRPGILQFRILGGAVDLDDMEFAPLIDDGAGTEGLFNGRDLSGWCVALEGRRPGEDPNGVFRVSDGVMRVSGEETGGIVSEKSYRDYVLRVEYRWVGKSVGSRLGMAADTGVLYHSQGEMFAWNGLWMRSFECNILRGRTGDFIIVSDKGAPVRYAATVEGRVVADEANISNWFRLGSWANTEDTPDVFPERRYGEWNRLEIVCDGSRVEHWLNDVLVFEAENLTPSQGRIQIQSEGHPVEFRRIDLKALR